MRAARDNVDETIVARRSVITWDEVAVEGGMGIATATSASRAES